MPSPWSLGKAWKDSTINSIAFVHGLDSGGVTKRIVIVCYMFNRGGVTIHISSNGRPSNQNIICSSTRINLVAVIEVEQYTHAD